MADCKPSQDIGSFLDGLSPKEREFAVSPVGFYAFIMLACQRGDISADMIEDLIVSRYLELGDVSPLASVLRAGKIGILHQSTLNLLADHLEGKIERKTGPKKSHSRFDRNIVIYGNFLQLKEKYGYDQAIDAIEKEFSVGRKTIEAIVSKFNKQKLDMEEALKIVEN